jgi:hypothetical protein
MNQNQNEEACGLLLTEVRSIWVPQNWVWGAALLQGVCFSYFFTVKFTIAAVICCAVWTMLELCQAVEDRILYRCWTKKSCLS